MFRNIMRSSTLQESLLRCATGAPKVLKSRSRGHAVTVPYDRRMDRQDQVLRVRDRYNLAKVNFII